ncbi:MAG: type II secretion system F family protein [Deltaproteobacteria bacterium]|nr:type II secretion system F family protein [Deltaproteobacteria bacterium]
MIIAFIILGACALGASIALSCSALAPMNRLRSLRDAAVEPVPQSAEVDLAHLDDWLGRSGLIEPNARRTFIASTALLIFLSPLITIAITAALGGSVLFIGSCLLCLTSTAPLFRLRHREVAHRGRLLSSLPLLLESLILLVESGLGLLPALAACSEASDIRHVPAARYFTLVYARVASGIPLSEAVRSVALRAAHPAIRHVLLHLDVAGSEGGKLGDALRSLSDYAHAEWKLWVEERVRRLENLAVFPVFASVLGLMLVIGAVPLAKVHNIRGALAAGGTPSAETLADPPRASHIRQGGRP